MNDERLPVEDPELDAFLASAVFGVDSDLDDDMPAPDLAAVVALAHELDPQGVPEGWLEESVGFAPIISLREGRRFRQTQNDPEMAAIVAQVRAAMDHQIGVELVERNLAPVPEVGQPAVSAAAPAVVTDLSSRRSVGRSWYVGLAAAALLMIGGAALATGTLASRDDSQSAAPAAASDRLVAPEAREAEVREPAVEARKAKPDVDANVLPGEQTLEPALVPEEPEEVEDAKPHRAARRESREERLARLDREAHDAWHDGNLAAARSKFERIVKIGGKHRLADLAYGDLLNIARRTGDTRQETRLWKTYLKSFPRGRFVEDAQAGLCRRAPSAKKTKCWERYLRDFPGGSYREQAELELGDGGS